jgi:hypothetical protein
MLVSKESVACELGHVSTPSTDSSLLLRFFDPDQLVLQAGTSTQVVFIRSEKRPVRRMVKQLLLKAPAVSSSSNCIRTRVFMVEHYEYTVCQHSTPFVLNGHTQLFTVSQYTSNIIEVRCCMNFTIGTPFMSQKTVAF